MACAPLTAASPAWAGADDRWGLLAETTFHHIARDGALAGVIATAIGQDGYGFLWIGSQDGLIRWDGYGFRVYRPDPNQTGSLPDNDIRVLFTDTAGQLWIGTSTGGLVRYDAGHDSFVAYGAGDTSLGHATITAITDDGTGGLWVGTEQGLYHLDPRTGAVLPWSAANGPAGKPGVTLPDNHIGALLRDKAGTLWIGTAKGLVRQKRGTSDLLTVNLPTTDGEAPEVRQVYQDSAGGLWVATISHGAFYLATPDGAAVPIREAHPDGHILATEGINTIVEVRPGEIWLGTYTHGMVSVTTDGLQTRRFVHDPMLPDSLLDDEVLALYRDRSGLVWVGTGQGFSRYTPEQDAVKTVFENSSRKPGISDVGILAVKSMPDGTVWLGMTRNGVDILDPTGWRVGHLAPDPSRPETALPQKYVWDFALSAKGDLYMATALGLYRTDLNHRSVARVHISGRNPNAHTTALLFDKDRLWVGGRDGLWCFDPDPSHKPDVVHVDALTDQRVRALVQGQDGALWIATENGLNRLDPAAQAIERILPDPKNPKGLGGGYLSSLLVDRRGRLWIGTSGGGVNILTGRDAQGHPQFRRLGVDDGMPNSNIDKLVEDHVGRIWASTDAGLAVIDPNSLSIRALRQADGLAITNFFVGGGTVTPQGEVLFPGSGGLVVVQPERLQAWTYKPPVVVTDIRIGGKSVPTAGFNGQAGGQAPVIIPPGKSLSVEFSALDYSAPRVNRYSYRLDGFDDAWVDTDATHRSANYTNLPPGNYTLELRGSNRDGLWGATVLALPVRVVPAWYQTLWFYAIAGILALAAIYGLVQGRTAYLRRRQQELQALIDVRTAELVQSQLQLEKLAYFDVLTGLPNRRMFTDDFRKVLALARRENRGFALLLIDLDRFKQINDTLGHDAGDALLIETAALLRSALRDTDCVARLGGDEFAILLVAAHDQANIDMVCGRIVASFLSPVLFKTKQISTSPSIGVAIYPNDGESQDSLYKSADLALYSAKQAGRNTWRRYGAVKA